MLGYGEHLYDDLAAFCELTGIRLFLADPLDHLAGTTSTLPRGFDGLPAPAVLRSGGEPRTRGDLPAG